MKAIMRDVPGYSEQSLANMLETFLYPSSIFDQPVPVRGICFAAGAESERLAREFGGGHLAFGLMVLRMETMSLDDWRGLIGALHRPKADLSRIAVVLPNLDLASEELQSKIGEAIVAIEGVVWLPTVRDHRRLAGRVKQLFVVYLGLVTEGKMAFLLQSGQRIRMDEGSFRRAGQ